MSSARIITLRADLASHIDGIRLPPAAPGEIDHERLAYGQGYATGYGHGVSDGRAQVWAYAALGILAGIAIGAVL